GWLTPPCVCHSSQSTISVWWGQCQRMGDAGGEKVKGATNQSRHTCRMPACIHQHGISFSHWSEVWATIWRGWNSTFRMRWNCILKYCGGRLAKLDREGVRTKPKAQAHSRST